MKLGIDFGTSFSLPATVYHDQNIILLRGGIYGIPSVFYYSEFDGILIGDEALRFGQGSGAKNLKREIKMDLKSSFTADGRTFSAKEIVGYFLGNVVDNALATAEEKLIMEPLEGVVISVPARFEHNEISCIKEAAEIPKSKGGPGLNVLGLVKEPVAAALAYFNSSLADKTRILVYDLGGGTCDVAIVEADSSLKEKFTVIDHDMLRIGGKDWDAKLEEYIIHCVEKECGKSVRSNPGYREKIKREAIVVKHSFSEKTITGEYRDKVRAQIEIDGSLYSVPITKTTFDEATLGLFNKTLEMTKNLLERNNGSSIDKIVCVGGSSNMPQVREGLERAFPNKTIQIFEPQNAIALGAAIYAQYCDGKDTYLSDIAAFSYGVLTCRDYDKDPNDLIIINIIQMGSRLPKTNSQVFLSVEDDQEYLTFPVYENSNNTYRYSFTEDHPAPIMEVNLSLPRNTKKNYPVTVDLTLTVDGLLTIKAYDDSGHSISASKQLIFGNNSDDDDFDIDFGDLLRF